jgi:EAL domain-containing protein (putative c-di-GMP-specific phosphodiesterase class I)
VIEEPRVANLGVAAHSPQQADVALPSVSATLDALRAPAQASGTLVILYLNFDRYATIEEIYGWEKLDAVLATTAAELRHRLAATPWRDAVLAANAQHDDDFVVFHVGGVAKEVSEGDVPPNIIRDIRDGIITRLEQTYGASIASLFDLYVGRAVIRIDPKLRFERQVYRGIREAASNAHNLEQQERRQLLVDLRETLRTGAIYIDYHPIVDASTGRIFGYEALARGTLRALRRPEVMFEVAAQLGNIWELSRVCRRRAIEGMRELLQPGELLFLNVDPHDFDDPTFTPADLATSEPERVVLEITERVAIKDYARFRDRLRSFRDHGFRFAVDDAGSGYAGLGSIANLEPDFIKLDLSLITGIDTNFIKQGLVESIVGFANEQGAKVIAEGVERAAEYEAVKKLGVHLVQGFFLHRPKQFPNKLERSLRRP